MRSNSPHPVLRGASYQRPRSTPCHLESSALHPVNSLTTSTEFTGRVSLSPATLRSNAPLNSSITTTSGLPQDSETTPLLGPETPVTEVYGRRWYLLVVFSLLALLQTLSWAMWGPISESAEAVLSWDDGGVSMTVFVGNASFAVCCIPFSWLMAQKGLRVSVILASLAVLAGACLRCLIQYIPSAYFTWCIYGGQLLNGIAGPVAQGAGSEFSNLWFPSNQRATATAIFTFVGYVGNALAFVIGPVLVASPNEDSGTNNTLPGGNDTNNAFNRALLLTSDNATLSEENTNVMQGIVNYLYYQTIAAVAVVVLVVAYFPAKPHHPPSLSAAVEREDFKPGLYKLFKNGQFWLIAVAFCLSIGVFEVWDVILDVNLSTIGISQNEAGWLGFYCVMAGCLTGLLICRLADFFFRQIRLFLIVGYLVSAIFVLWFILIYISILPFDMVSIYASIIMSGVFLDGCCPLVYELVCEAAYPVGEGVASCVLQMLFVLVGMAFTAVQGIPNIGTGWMNWCLLGSLCAAIPLLCCVSDTYGRADLDDKVEQVVTVETPDSTLEQPSHKPDRPSPPFSHETTPLLATRSISSLHRLPRPSANTSDSTTFRPRTKSLLSGMSREMSSLLPPSCPPKPSVLTTVGSRTNSLLAISSRENASHLLPSLSQNTSVLTTFRSCSKSITPNESSSLIPKEQDKNTSELNTVGSRSNTLLSRRSRENSSILQTSLPQDTSVLITGRPHSNSLTSRPAKENTSLQSSSCPNNTSVLRSQHADSSRSRPPRENSSLLSPPTPKFDSHTNSFVLIPATQNSSLLLKMPEKSTSVLTTNGAHSILSMPSKENSPCPPSSSRNHQSVLSSTRTGYGSCSSSPPVCGSGSPSPPTPSAYNDTFSSYEGETSDRGCDFEDLQYLLQSNEEDRMCGMLYSRRSADLC